MFCELHIKLIFYESPISYDYESHPLDDRQALGWLDNTDVLPLLRTHRTSHAVLQIDIPGVAKFHLLPSH